MDGLANLHLRMNLWNQAIVLEFLAVAIIACTGAFIGILQSAYSYYYYVYVPGDAVWMLIVAIITLTSMGYFLYAQPTAKQPDYVPAVTFFSMGITMSALWFTSAVALAAGSVSGCVYLTPGYSSYLTSLCVTGGLADALAWFCFAGSLMFTLTMYAVGSKVGSWRQFSQQNVQMGAMPVKVTQPPPPYPQQQLYSQQPYSQQPYPQQSYPQQSFPASPAPQPQQLYSQQSYPASPVQPTQQLYSQQSFPVSPAPVPAHLPEHPQSPPPQSFPPQSFDYSPALPDQIYRHNPPNAV